MILVDKICSYFTSIVLVWITYLFLAETKSINSFKVKWHDFFLLKQKLIAYKILIFFLDTFFYQKNLTDQNILLYTTGSYLKYYSINQNFELKTNTLNSFKNFPVKQYKLFDFYFKDNDLLNIIAFDRKEKNFIIGYLNLNQSTFEENQKIFYNNSDIHFVVDKIKNIVYIANKEKNSIDFINLNNLDKNILLDCNSPDFIEFNENSNSLSWLEKKEKSCFYEWQLDKKEKKLITCVDQLNVQGFQINLNETNLYYFLKNGNLYNINLKSLDNNLIYKNYQKRIKYKPNTFKFQLIDNYYFFSDLTYKAIFMVNLENSKLLSKLLFTDVPCIYDFRILSKIDEDNLRNYMSEKIDNTLIERIKNTVIENLNTEKSNIDKTESPKIKDIKTLSSENLKQVNIEFCTLITCNYIINLILISFTFLILLVLTLFVFLSKKRFNSLLEDQQELPNNFLLKKFSLIRMNLKKMMQQF